MQVCLLTLVGFIGQDHAQSTLKLFHGLCHGLVHKIVHLIHINDSSTRVVDAYLHSNVQRLYHDIENHNRY